MTYVTRCQRCIMDDSSDTTILFDNQGYCNYCTNALAQKDNIYFPNLQGKLRLTEMLSTIKNVEKNNRYDCIMGISGGLDSSYLAYLGHKWGLRVLAVHIDDGYDTEITKSNLKKLIEATGFDYKVIVPDPEQYNNLTLAYMKAGVPNIAAPQDNILLAFLYQTMRKEKISYFLSGGNFALESILQKSNTYKNSDFINIKAINKKHGTLPLNKLHFMSTIKGVLYEKCLGIKSVRPLNYVDYNRDKAFEELSNFCGYEYYGSKHLENILTAFAQLYWFPNKFGVDKRTSHLSSMIISGQMTREQALEEYNKPLCNEKQLESYIDFVREKLNISKGDFKKIIEAPIHLHVEYETEDRSIIFSSLKIINKIFFNRSKTD